MIPKVFISYSWTSQEHQNRIREWADRLAGDGVEIILDQYDLKEGQDKYAFMERMITDPTVSHALVFSDRIYAEKADGRQGGVGTETQIISREVYEKVEQSKFIPIVCEVADDEQPYLPTFLKSRIYFNFSTLEAVNENWERLIRTLHGKPLFEKPPTGKPPAYILSGSKLPPTPLAGKFATLKQAILNNRVGTRMYRLDFLEACTTAAATLKAHDQSSATSVEESLMAACANLVIVREYIVDWVLFESQAAPSEEFSKALITLLAKLLEIKSARFESNLHDPVGLEARSIFAYETFLYIVAVLLKYDALDVLHAIFAERFLDPDFENSGKARFQSFSDFYASSRLLSQSLVSPNGQSYITSVGELIKRQATMTEAPFKALIEVDILILLNAFASTDVRWYPQLLVYAGYRARLPFFQKAVRRQGFEKLRKIVGATDADGLRKSVRAGIKRLNAENWSNVASAYHDTSYLEAMNLENLNTEM